MKNRQPGEETGRVLAVAALVWGSVVGIGALEGAFARFEVASLAMLAAFVSLFAVASYFLDPQLRAYAAERDPLRASALALVFAAAFVVALALGSAPFAMLFAPLAALASVAVATTLPRRASLRRGAKSASLAKSPGANPAAT